MGFWPVVLNVLRNSDVVLLIADARIPEITQNSEIINKVSKTKTKKLIIIFNKSDLIKQKDIKDLKKEYPGAFFVSATKRTGTKNLKTTLENMAENWHRPSLRIGIVGYPNVGKSTLLNILVPGAKAKISPMSGTTKKTYWFRSGKLRIIDSPGVIPSEDKKVQIGITASKDPHKIKNPEKVAIKIIEFLIKQNKNILERMYKVSGENSYEIFENIARKRGFLVKGGEIDENRTSIKIIDDWQKGKITLK